MEKEKILYEDVIPGGWNWSHNLKRGTALRLTDLDGGANVSVLLYNAHNYSERYNLADTLKAQYISYFTKGSALYSDMGRILLSVIGDESGWIDAIGGVSSAKTVEKQYGEKSFQSARNSYHRNGKESLLAEIMKYGMSARDYISNINVFSKIIVDKDGNTSFDSDFKTKGKSVDLQAEMDTLVVLNTCPHPSDPSPTYQPGEIKIQVWESNLSPEENPCRTSCEQNERGFINTIRYHL